MSKKNTTTAKKTTFANEIGGANLDARKQVALARQKLQQNKSQTNIESAFKTLSEVCNKESNIPEAFSLRASCYNLMGDFQRALYDYSVAIKIAKENEEEAKNLPMYYSMAGVQHYELGQLDEALKHYNLAIEKQ